LVRPKIVHRDLAPALRSLNEREASGNGVWKTDRSEMTSAVKFFDKEESLGVSQLEPDQVVQALCTT